MAIMDVGQRRYLFEKRQQYLFSYDLKIQRRTEAVLPSGLRWTLAARNVGHVFHVLDDRRVLGNDALTGNIFSFEETIDIARAGEAALSRGRMIMDLGDGKVFADWEGVLHLGPRYFATHVEWHVDPPSIEVRSQLACRFETSNQKYKWLTEQLSATFGTYQLRDGHLESATFDVYGLV